MRGSEVIAGLYLLELDQSACACVRHGQQHQRTQHNHRIRAYHTPHHTPHHTTPHTHTTHTHTTPHTPNSHHTKHTPHHTTPNTHHTTPHQTHTTPHHTQTPHTHTPHTPHTTTPNRKCLHRQTGDWLLGAACVTTCSTHLGGGGLGHGHGDEGFMPK